MRRGSVAPWVRLDVDYANDPRVRRAKAVPVWPWIIARMKAGSGFVSDDDLAADFMAEQTQLPEDLCAHAVAALKKVGLLTWGEDEINLGGRNGDAVRKVYGWTTPRWDDFQPDARQRSDRRDGSHGGKPAPQAAPSSVETRSTVEPSQTVPGMVSHGTLRDITVRDVVDLPEAVRDPGVAASLLAGAREERPARSEVIAGPWPEPQAPPPAPAPKLQPGEPQPVPPGCDRTIVAWRSATPGTPNQLSGLLVHEVVLLVREFGADAVIAGVEEQVRTTGGAPSPKYVRRVCEGRRDGRPKPAPALRPEQQSTPILSGPDPLARLDEEITRRRSAQ